MHGCVVIAIVLIGVMSSVVVFCPIVGQWLFYGVLLVSCQRPVTCSCMP